MKTLLILIALLLVGCEPPPREQIQYSGRNIDQLYIKRVRKCEYVVHISSGKYGIAHAGDCSNPAHKEQPK